MAVTPNSTIKIMKNVPLDNTYNHTVKFANLSAQTTYFSSNTVVKYTLTKQTYQRVGKGKMRVEISADNLYDCNYLAFQNTAYGTKWFYAFIIGEPEYVNDVTSEITYEIDVMQTYLFDITIGECFVEREHVTDDTVGANTIGEPIDCPEASVNDYYPLWFGKWRIAIQTAPGLINQIAYSVCQFCMGIINAPTPSETIPGAFITVYKTMATAIFNVFTLLQPDTPASFREHMFSGSNIYITDHYIDFTQSATEAQNLAQYIDGLVARGHQVINVYQVPEEAVTGVGTPFTDIPEGYFQPVSAFPYTVGSNSYTPKNNKLKTSPYTYMKVINKQGGEMNLAFEKMHEKKFYLSCSWANGIVETLLGMSKYGDTNTATGNLVRLSLTDFPVCSWNTNGIMAKLVAIAGKLTSSLNNQVTSGMMKPSNEKPITRQFGESGTAYFERKAETEHEKNIQSGVSTLGSYIANLGQVSNSIIGDVGSINGGARTCGCDVKDEQFGYEIYQMCISGEHARMIDNFFEHYGYAVKVNKVPNIDSRPHWNYVKTADAYIKGNCPATALSKIISIFNSGITFWKTPSEVGNYSLNNH